ncbi:hypothetical protein P261_02010 [Lachnospiraceae bacterium TWA4]|nr:hypothetical protein P261_02010 [Lachnospiraceae bacterium TWA4]
MKKKIIYLLLLSVILLSGCKVNARQETTEATQKSMEETSKSTSLENTSASRELFAMDTYMTITAYGKGCNEAINQAEEEITYLDNLLSTGNESSEVSLLNKNKQGEVSKATATLLEESLDLYDKTNGAFNPAIYPIMEEWGFTTKNYKVPTEEKLEELLKVIDPSKISYEDYTVSLGSKDLEIDFGGIAKGYTSSRIMEIFKENGVTSGLVSLGGNVQALGSKVDGSDWKVAIQNPNGTEDYLGILQINNQAVITSGGYERYFEEDGKTYHHIIDPATGYPADSGIVSSTIVSGNGLLADGLSTSLFVMGLDKSMQFWKEHSDEFDAILLTEDGKLYVTEGIEHKFSSDLEVNVIKRVN